MINILCLLILVLCRLFSAENVVEICSNGVFKCVSATSLRICFHGQLVSSEFVCPDSTYCSEYSETICTDFSDYDYDDSFQSNEEKFKPETNPDLKCTQVGSFPIPNSSCQNYYKCIKKDTGFLIKQLTCYTGSFDPVSQTCSDSYICPEDCPLEIPQCTTTGDFPIPNTGCKKYVSCTETQNGWESQVKNCFNRGFFNPAARRCDKFYMCTETTKPDSCITTPDTTPTITDSTTITNSPITNSTTITDSPITSVTVSKPPITETPITNQTDDVSTNSTTITDSPITSVTVSKPPITDSPITNTTENKPPITNSPITNATDNKPPITDSPITNVTENKPPVTDLPITTENKPPITDSPITNVTENKPPITDSPITNTTGNKPPITGSPITNVTENKPPITDSPITNTTENKPPITDSPITNVTENKSPITDSPITSTTENEPSITDSPITNVTENKPPITDLPSTNVTENKPPITDSPITNTTENKPPITDSPITKTTENKPPITDSPITKTTENKPPVTDSPITHVTGNKPPTTDSPITHVTGNKPPITDSPITHVTGNKPPVTDSPITHVTGNKPPTTNSPITHVTGNKPPITDSPITNTTDDVLTNSTSITDIPITNATENKPPITVVPITNSTAITDSPITNTTTTESPIADTPTTISIPSTTISVPECTQSGRFPLPNSECKQYVLCIVTSQGFLQQILDCPLNAFFDPVTQRCKRYYICTEKATTTTTTATTLVFSTTDFEEFNTTEEPSTRIQEFTSIVPSENSNCLEKGEFPVANTNCTKYLHCIVTTNGFLEQIFECASGTKFDPTLQKCSKTYICSESPTDIENLTTIDDDTKCVKEATTIPDCLEQGKFPIIGVSCQKYILCVQTRTGMKGKQYECPKEAYFDPEKRRCLVNYQCTEKLCISTPIFEVTTELIPTEVPNCLLQGRIEISGTKCKKFLLCVETKQGFVSSVYTCPAGSFFHPIKKRCSESYVCQEEIRSCSTLGRFPDPMDKSCKFYYECVEQEVNNIQGIKKECKNGYYFDPEIQKCSATYNCLRNFLLKATVQNVISPRFLVNGQCTTVGRYVVQLSSCKNYVYCSANTDGTLKATNFTCPTTTVFNQAIQKCTSTTSYTCPDNVCMNNPGFIAWANPNAKDCTTYITCQMVLDNFGMILGYSGVINYCPQGQRFNPIGQSCDPWYVCPTNVNGK